MQNIHWCWYSNKNQIVVKENSRKIKDSEEKVDVHGNKREEQIIQVDTRRLRRAKTPQEWEVRSVTDWKTQGREEQSVEVEKGTRVWCERRRHFRGKRVIIRRKGQPAGYDWRRRESESNRAKWARMELRKRVTKSGKRRLAELSVIWLEIEEQETCTERESCEWWVLAWSGLDRYGRVVWCDRCRFNPEERFENWTLRWINCLCASEDSRFERTHLSAGEDLCEWSARKAGWDCAKPLRERVKGTTVQLPHKSEEKTPEWDRQREDKR